MAERAAALLLLLAAAATPTAADPVVSIIIDDLDRIVVSGPALVDGAWGVTVARLLGLGHSDPDFGDDSSVSRTLGSLGDASE